MTGTVTVGQPRPPRTAYRCGGSVIASRGGLSITVPPAGGQAAGAPAPAAGQLARHTVSDGGNAPSIRYFETASSTQGTPCRATVCCVPS